MALRLNQRTNFVQRRIAEVFLFDCIIIILIILFYLFASNTNHHTIDHVIHTNHHTSDHINP